MMGAFVFVLIISMNANAADISREYKIKAAYLYNLIKFVNWPASDQAPPLAINICVFLDSPFKQYLNVLSERTIKARRIDILYIDEQTTLKSCNVLYISKTNTHTSNLLEKSTQYPLLTVGETTEFLNKGGIIGLIIDDNNIQLQINLTQAKTAGFAMSGNLLEIAKKIQ